MVNFCCAYNCSSSSDIHRNLQFHKFPDAVKDKDRRQKWIIAIKRKDFSPKNSTKLCSLHFTEKDYDPPIISGSKRLRKDAVPSVFDFPEHLMPKKPRERRPLERNALNQENQFSGTNEKCIDDTTSSSTMNEPSFKSVAVQTTLTGMELTKTLSELRREKKCIQQQIKRRNHRLSNMADMIVIEEELLT